MRITSRVIFGLCLHTFLEFFASGSIPDTYYKTRLEDEWKKSFMYITGPTNANSTRCSRDTGDPCYYVGEEIAVNGWIDYGQINDPQNWNRELEITVDRLVSSMGYNDSSRNAVITPFCQFLIADSVSCTPEGPTPKQECWCTGKTASSGTSGAFNYTYASFVPARDGYDGDVLFLAWGNRYGIMSSGLTVVPLDVRNETVEGPSDGGSSPQLGVIIGGVVGGLAFVAVIGGVCYFLVFKKEKVTPPPPVDPVKKKESDAFTATDTNESNKAPDKVNKNGEGVAV